MHYIVIIRVNIKLMEKVGLSIRIISTKKSLEKKTENTKEKKNGI